MLAVDEESLDDVIPGGLRLDGRFGVIGFLLAAAGVLAFNATILVTQRVTPQQKSLAQARLVSGLKFMLTAEQAEAAGEAETADEAVATAIEAFDEALAANPALDSAYGWRAEAYLATGDLKAAVTDFDTAIDREVSIPVNRAGRGETALRAGKYLEAIEDLDFAIAAWESGEVVAPARPPREAPDPRRRTLEELRELRAEAVVRSTATEG